MDQATRDTIEFQFKYLNKPEIASQLSEQDLNWAIKMQNAYDRQGWLSPKQIEIVYRIYEKA